MSEIVTRIGTYELDLFEQEHAAEIREIVPYINESYGTIGGLLKVHQGLEYDRVQFLLSKSKVLQTLFGIEIQKRVDEAELVVAQVIDGKLKASDLRVKTAWNYLKTIGRSRGYTDGSTSVGAGSINGENIQMIFTHPNDTDLALLPERQPGPGRPKRDGVGVAPVIEVIDVPSTPVAPLVAPPAGKLL